MGNIISKSINRMDKEIIKYYHKYFNEAYTEWYTYPKDRDEIEQRVRAHASNMPTELYCIISPDNASGLMAHGFFESDLKKTIGILGEMLK